MSVTLAAESDGERLIRRDAYHTGQFRDTGSLEFAYLSSAVNFWIFLHASLSCFSEVA